MRRFAAALLSLALAACSRGTAPSAPSGPPGAPPAVPAPAAGPAAAYVSAVATLRREPSDTARVKGSGRKEVPNALAVLQRGEKITLLEAREDWARVRTSDDREGWLARASVLEGDGIVEATVLVAADVFDRPDLLAANARRRIEPATLLLVVKSRPPFSEVNVSSGPNAWVLTERLATGEKEVSVAKLAEKARYLVRSGKPEEARQIVTFARQQFAGTPLVETVAAELGDPAAPGGAVVPASAPTVTPDR